MSPPSLGRSLRRGALVLLPLIAPSLGALRAAPARAAEAGESKEVKLQKLYDQAFGYYKSGDYGRAIRNWDEILRLDPQQKTAGDMIREVQANVEKANAKRLAAVMGHVKRGQYRSALDGLETLLENGNRTPFASDLQTQLEDISHIVPQAPDKGKAWRLTVLSIDAALSYNENYKLAYNGLRYARELDPADQRIKSLLDWFLTRHPEFANFDIVTPGMNLLDYKRSLALDHMYGGRLHQAIDTLLEVLALEPDDLVALKRLGSAYFSLGLRDKARGAWRHAANLDPADLQLKKFIRKVAAGSPPAN